MLEVRTVTEISMAERAHGTQQSKKPTSSLASTAKVQRKKDQNKIFKLFRIVMKGMTCIQNVRTSKKRKGEQRNILSSKTFSELMKDTIPQILEAQRMRIYIICT